MSAALKFNRQVTASLRETLSTGKRGIQEKRADHAT